MYKDSMHRINFAIDDSDFDLMNNLMKHYDFSNVSAFFRFILRNFNFCDNTKIINNLRYARKYLLEVLDEVSTK